jgi:hypothetical protein
VNRHYPVVARRAGHRCEYCHAPEAVFNLPFEVEHVAPWPAGGSDDDANLALACRSCNLYKSVHVSVTDDVTGKEARLFDPRREAWSDHFEADAVTGEIVPRTASGRVTVTVLRLNGPLQIEARRQWMRLGLFP